MIFTKAMRAGKAAVFAMGLTVVLVLVFGAATTALAAVPGDPFRLGQLNTIDRASQLVGSARGTLLKVDNNGTGPALFLEANAGRPPLAVNATAGKATNLNADRLDGLDSAAFQRSGSKAADSDRLDGKDSSQFMPASTYSVESAPTIGHDIGNGGNGWRQDILRCDPGDQLLSGGHLLWESTSASFELVASLPVTAPGFENTWMVRWTNRVNPDQPDRIKIYALCADTAAPAHGQGLG